MDIIGRSHMLITSGGGGRGGVVRRKKSKSSLAFHSLLVLTSI